MAVFLFAGGMLALAGFFAAFGLSLVLEIVYQGYPGVASLSTLLLALIVLRGVVLFAGTRQPQGVPIDPKGQPGLAEAIRQVAERLMIRPPGRVVLVPEADVWIECRFWFFRPQLTLGLALVESLSVEQLQAVLAGQLAGFNDSLLWRIDQGLLRALRESARNLISLPFLLWARLIHGILAPIVRHMKKAADRRAARTAGKNLYANSLQEAFGASQMFFSFLHKEILSLLSAGGLPDNLYSGYRIWLERTAEREKSSPAEAPQAGHKESPGMQDILQKLPGISPLRKELEERLRDLVDEYPPDGFRDPRPARLLILEVERVERAVTPFVTATFRRQGLFRLSQKPRVVSWSEVEDDIIVPQQEARTRHILQTLGTLFRRQVQPREGIDLYLSLLEVPDLRARLAGRLEPGMSRLPPSLYPHVIQAILARFLGTLVGAALIERRGYRWEKPIARPLQLVSGGGERFNPFNLAQGLLSGEYGVRHFRMTLFEHGLFVSEQ